MTDKYDKAIKYLTGRPHEIRNAWLETNSHPAGCLFSFVDDRPGYAEDCGCLTIVKSNGDKIEGQPELMDQINKDDLIPTEGSDISVESLPAFAKYNRLLDDLYGEVVTGDRI